SRRSPFGRRPSRSRCLVDPIPNSRSKPRTGSRIGTGGPVPFFAGSCVLRRRGKVKVLASDSGAMAAPPSEVAAGGMNKWKVLTAVFVVLTIVLAGGLAYVATLPRGTSATVTYPIGVEIAISGTYATDGPLRRD